MSWPNCAWTRWPISAGDRGTRDPDLPLLADVLAADLLLQLDDPVQQGLGAWRAPGHVDVDRHDLVHALRHRVRVPVRAAAVRAGAERDDVLRLRHLVVDPLEGRGHLVGERPGHYQQVRLAGPMGERDHA